MLAGIPVHVIQRGNNRQQCFYEDQDREFYLFHLRRLLGKAECALHAYCLMTNHVNRNYGRTGSLWEGRYRSCLVQAEDYLLTCYRYVEMNPVRAKLVAHPGDYPWSSYRSNVEGVTNVLLTPHDEYLRLGASSAERRGAYKELVHQLMDSKQLDEIRTATNGNFALGARAFCQRVSAALGRRVQRASPGRPRLARPTGQLDLPDGPEKNVVCP